MVAEGTDWDRKNRLKVYDAMHALSIREFNKSAKHLLETLSTFTAVELIDYEVRDCAALLTLLRHTFFTLLS
jgi:26S proteasome regulatory subunit N7